MYGGHYVVTVVIRNTDMHTNLSICIFLKILYTD